MHTEMMFVSQFTLALMQDTGWYIVDYNYSEAFFWGHGEGCQWFLQDCVNKTTEKSNFAQYFCDSTADHGCGHDYAGVAYCEMYTSLDDIPIPFQYYVSIQNAFGSSISLLIVLVTVTRVYSKVFAIWIVFIFCFFVFLVFFFHNRCTVHIYTHTE